MAATDLAYEMFPLEQFLRDYPVDYDRLFHHNLPTLLLSQVKSLNRDHVEQLERLGVYDTEDFSQAGSELMKKLNLDEFHYDIMAEQIKEIQEKRVLFPRIILDLPKNYAIITAYSTPHANHLGIYWRGLRIKYNRPVSEYWNPIKHQLDEALSKMNHPELIGRLHLQSPPHWLEDVSPLSTYLSNLSLDESLLDTALSWGMSSEVMEEYDGVDQYLLAQLYLMKLANKIDEY